MSDNITTKIKKTFDPRFANLNEDLSSIDKQIIEYNQMISEKKSELEEMENEIKMEEELIVRKTEKENNASKWKKINALWNKKTIIFEMIIELQKNKQDLLRLKLQYRNEQNKLTTLVTKYEYDHSKNEDTDVDITTAARLLTVLGNVGNKTKSNNDVSNTLSDKLDLKKDIDLINQNEKYSMS